MTILDVADDLLLTPWRGTTGEHDVRGQYVERFYTPWLGPSTYLLARNIAAHLERADRTAGTFGCHRTTREQLGGEVGLPGLGRQSHINRTITRLVQYRLADLQPAAEFDGAYLLFRTSWPDLAANRALRLPPHLRIEWAHLHHVSVPLDGEEVSAHG